ncbi:ABC transporter permease [Nonomuraea rhodomycinica]|uniref:ABC transporter permease n=1 Tax=Nonomuraea rhodomycinica TaxID=1712872 RepID=A0A7Y6IK62_9ACTN|nr:ABC transporter permease [Nonomuraea rhodomycinica]NUW39235.1 ABC transporter permease [Nonomuraea rhodomycinica]
MSSLVLAHTRYQLLEQIRVPLGLVASAFFPAASMLAFVVPFAGDDPAGATRATGSMMLIGAMSAALMGLSISVAQDREQPWNPYLRTLPAGPFPRFAGRILTTMAVMLVAAVPVLVIAALLTKASVTAPRLALGMAALLAGSLPFMLIGLFLGFLLPSKAAIGVSQVVFFPIAIVGGLFMPPQVMPEFLQALSPYAPSRGAAELVWSAATGATPGTTGIVMLVVWTVAAALAAAWAYRRDEGRRFS